MKETKNRGGRILKKCQVPCELFRAPGWIMFNEEMGRIVE